MERDRPAMGGVGRGAAWFDPHVPPPRVGELRPRGDDDNKRKQRRDGDRRKPTRDYSGERRRDEKSKRDHSGQRRRDERPRGFNQGENADQRRRGFGCGEGYGSNQQGRRREEETLETFKHTSFAPVSGRVHTQFGRGLGVEEHSRAHLSESDAFHGFGRADEVLGDAARSGERPRNNQCRKCGEEGHRARECPKNDPGFRSDERQPFREAMNQGHLGNYRETRQPHFEQWPRQVGKEESAGFGVRDNAYNVNFGDRAMKSGPCFTCGVQGHLSRDCPEKHSRQPSAHLGFRNEEQPFGRKAKDLPGAGFKEPQHQFGMEGSRGRGHGFEDATKNQEMAQGLTKARPPHRCHTCDQEGHYSRNCPQTRGDGRTVDRQNTRQGADNAVGFDSRSSPRQSGDRDLDARTCYRCGKEGHLIRHCAQSDGTRRTPEAQWNFDAQVGGVQGPAHEFAIPQSFGDIPMEQKRQEVMQRKPVTCYNCKKEGHISRDCPESRDIGSTGEVPPWCPFGQGPRIAQRDLAMGSYVGGAVDALFQVVNSAALPTPPSMNDLSQFPMLESGSVVLQTSAAAVDGRRTGDRRQQRHSVGFENEATSVQQRDAAALNDQEANRAGPGEPAVDERRGPRDKPDFGGRHGQREKGDFNWRRGQRGRTDFDDREDRGQRNKTGFNDEAANRPQRERTVKRADEKKREGDAHEDGEVLDAQAAPQLEPKAIIDDQAQENSVMGFGSESDLISVTLAMETVQETKRVSHVEHDVLLVDQFAKKDELERLVLRDRTYRESDPCNCGLFAKCVCKKRVLVFAERRITVEAIKISLSTYGVAVATIHSDTDERDRQRALARFKFGKEQILVLLASEVNAGMADHFGDVAWLVNLNVPSTIDEYNARVKLVSREGKQLLVTSFYDSLMDFPLAGYLIQVMNDAGQVPPEWLMEQTLVNADSASENGGGED